MNTIPDDNINIGSSNGRARQVRILRVVSLVLVVAVAAGLAGLIVLAVQGPSPIALVLLGAALVVGLGLGMAALTYAGAALFTHLQHLSERGNMLEQRVTVLTQQLAERFAALSEPRESPVAEESRELLAEIRDILLLPIPQRAQRLAALMDREYARHMQVIDQHNAMRDFHRARQELAALVERFGDNERVQAVRDRIEKAAESARASDVAYVITQIKDLIGLGHWEAAEGYARELGQKYPNAPESDILIDQIRRERRTFEQRNRQRMHDEIQQLVNQRRWQEAAEATGRFLVHFPEGPDSDALRAQSPTLQANAEIQTRRQLEQQFKQLIAQQQYWDALALARRIIADYPMSPQADVLRRQLPRLEERAHSTAQPAGPIS